MTQATHPDVAEWLEEGGGGDLSRRKADAWSPVVRSHAAHNLNLWCAWLETQDPPVPLLAADRRLFRKWLEERKAAGLSAATRRKNWQYVRAFYTFCATPHRDGGFGYLPEDPMAAVQGPRVSMRPATRTAKVDEVAALEAHYARQASLRRGGGEAERARRNLAMVSLMFRSGCRSGELPAMDLADLVDTGHGHRAIRLRSGHTKSGEARLVPVTAETGKYLDRYLRLRGSEPGPLFRGRDGHTRATDGRLSAKAVQQVVQRAAKATGVPVSAHQLRRGWAAQYVRDGGDTTSMEVIGGWTDHRMPARYLADEREAAAIARFHAVNEGRSRLRAV